MSILYDYLKILEKKKKEDGFVPDVPVAQVPQKNSVSVTRYFIAGLSIFVCVLILFFLNNIKEKFPAETARVAVNHRDLNFIPRDLTAQEGLSRGKSRNLDFSLKGIIFNTDSPSAIINSQLIEKNSKIDDWQVMEISPSEVKLENTSNKSLLTLKLDPL